MKTLFILASVLLFPHFFAHAQQYPLRLFNEEQGLNSLSVMSILASEKGYVWIGTHSGVYRFDGASFREFRHEDSSVWYVMDLLEDRHGTIWIASGVGLFKISGDEVIRVHDTGFPSNGGFNSLYEDKDGIIRFGTSARGAGFMKEGSLHYTENIPQENVYRILSHPQGGFLIAIHTGLIHKKPDGTIHRLLDGMQVRDIFFDVQGRLWAGTFNGVYVMESGEIINHLHDANGLSGNKVWRIHYGKSGMVFAATATGLSRITPEMDITLIQEEHGLVNEQLQVINEDREGNLLLGTSYSGMYMLYNRHFTHYPLTGPEKQTRVTNISPDAGNRLWLSTWSDGVIVLEPQGRTVKHITLEHGLPDDRITSALPFDDGTAWIGTRHNGLYRYQEGSARPLRLTGSPADSYILYMTRTDDRAAWISTHDEGIFIFRDGQFSRPFEGSKLEGRIVTSIIPTDRPGVVWMAMRNGGIARADEQSGEVLIFGSSSGLPDELVFTIAAGADQTIWTAHHSGLSLFNTDEHSFYNFEDDADPLDGQFVLSMAPDQHEGMWLGLTRGLLYFRDGRFRWFSRDDGLTSDRFEDGSVYSDPDGYVWLGTYNGMLRVHPRLLPENTPVPPVYIGGVQVMNREVSAENENPITTTYYENFIRISLNAVSFTTPGNVRYRYRLQSGDSDWFETDQPEIQLVSLSPGSYKFEAQASVDGARWSEIPASLAFSVTPPLWQNNWFRAGALALLFIVGWTAYHYRVRRLLEMERLRTRIASDLHDDIGSTLTRISLYSELVARQPSPEKNRKYVDSISSLSRSLLTTMSDIVWSIDARSDTWGDLIARMQDYAGSTLQAADIKHKLVFKGIDEDSKIPVDIRQNLYLIFKEAVSNAARHSGATQVEAELENNPQQITLTITDNGRGITGEKHRGHGLKNMELRAGRIGGRLSVTSTDEGCRIELIRESR